MKLFNRKLYKRIEELEAIILGNKKSIECWALRVRLLEIGEDRLSSNIAIFNQIFNIHEKMYYPKHGLGTSRDSKP